MPYTLLTGASSGIGAAAAVELSRRGHHVLAVGRSEAKLERVWAHMRRAAGGAFRPPDPVAVDLASLDAVEELADRVSRASGRLDVLALNAGIEGREPKVTADGHEEVFAVNHLAPFLLASLLAGHLRRSAGRVVVTASDNYRDGRLFLPDLMSDWSPEVAYDRSKLANVLFAAQAPGRLGVPAVSFHPGSIRTDLNRGARTAVTEVYERLAYRSPQRGARPLVHLATASAETLSPGAYYVRGRPRRLEGQALQAGLADELWAYSAQAVSTHLPAQPSSDRGGDR